MDFTSLVALGYLSKIQPSLDLAQKEMLENDIDLKAAESELKNGGYKWSIIKSYYSMFHSSKSILFLLGYKEKSHFGVGESLSVLSKSGKLESSFVNDFKAAISAREGADYHYSHDESTAKDMYLIAKGFCFRMKQLFDKIKSQSF